MLSLTTCTPLFPIFLIFVSTSCLRRIKDNKRNDLMSFVEIKGQYVDGMLQNNDNDNKGRGQSNLLMSFMFGGKRFWGP